MKNTIMYYVPMRGATVFLFGISVVLFLALSPLSVHAETFSPITSQLDYGQTSENVTNLQRFLAANTAIYPEGKVTGYFGSLTQAAIVRFQKQYGLDPVGRVGPLTLAKINILINSGGWLSGADVSGPQFTSVYQSITSNTATFTWNTNELANAKIFYYTSPITMNEGDINSVGFGATNGWVANNDGLARTSQQVTISGLQPNTLYYYVIVSTDLVGNVSVWNPNITFRTN